AWHPLAGFGGGKFSSHAPRALRSRRFGVPSANEVVELFDFRSGSTAHLSHAEAARKTRQRIRALLNFTRMLLGKVCREERSHLSYRGKTALASALRQRRWLTFVRREALKISWWPCRPSRWSTWFHPATFRR